MAVVAYLLAWGAAVGAGWWYWRWALAPHGGTKPARVASRALVVVALAWAAAAYWNGAVLDPLQYRGFPDYVTQMRGARRLLEGALPYDPHVRAWADVNLPPVTLLLVFAPFTILSDQAGRLAYFALNHAAFIVALAVLLRGYPGRLGATGVALALALAAVFEPWHDSLRLGQQNGIVLLCLAVSAIAAAARRDVAAGTALALALIGKPSSALIGLYFLIDRRWRVVIAAGAVGLGLVVATLPWVGLETWRFYVLEKAPDLLAGTPQQSNVALLAFHARLFLPLDALASFDAMPELPAAATVLTRVSQVAGVVALVCFVRRRGRRPDGSTRLLEYGVALALSLVLVGHAWQSYVTWMIVAFVPLADPAVWTAIYPRARVPTAALAAVCYAAMAIDDVALHRVVGATSTAAAVFAALPTFALLIVAYVLALLAAGRDSVAR